MDAFVYNGLPARVVFGEGTRYSLSEELARLGCKRALILSTAEQAEQASAVRRIIGGLAVGSFSQATMHTPSNITEEALDVLSAVEADCTVAIGGGSTIGLGKAIAFRTDLPQVVLPTTYAGSEVTPILGETADGRKTTRRTRKVLPETVIYDTELTISLPSKLSVTSGINSMAHAVEALWAENRNPITSLMAGEAIRVLTDALPRIVARPRNREARSQALYGAWLSATCLATVGMALHHKLCHVLGGTFNLPHSDTHTVVLPHVMAYNVAALDAIMEGGTIPGNATANGLRTLIEQLGGPTSLRELGMPESGIKQAVELALRDQYWNPRAPDGDSIEQLITDAWAGNAPRPLIT
jgi:maleylacetate reductase